MPETIEWVQCRSCGRRYRWTADIAGCELECACGSTFNAPRLGESDDPAAASNAARRSHADATMAGTSPPADAPDRDDPGVAEPLIRPNSRHAARLAAESQLDTDVPDDLAPHSDAPDDDDPLFNLPPPKYRRQRTGIGSFQKVVIWGVAAAIGFVLIVHAVVVQVWYYVALTALVTPAASIGFWFALRRWRGDRTLLQAFLDEVGDDDDDEDDAPRGADGAD